MFSLNEWFPKTKAVLDSVQADIVLACLLLNSTQVLAELGSAQLKLVFLIIRIKCQFDGVDYYEVAYPKFRASTEVDSK